MRRSLRVAHKSESSPPVDKPVVVPKYSPVSGDTVLGWCDVDEQDPSYYFFPATCGYVNAQKKFFVLHWHFYKSDEEATWKVPLEPDGTSRLVVPIPHGQDPDPRVFEAIFSSNAREIGLYYRVIPQVVCPTCGLWRTDEVDVYPPHLANDYTVVCRFHGNHLL